MKRKRIFTILVLVLLDVYKRQLNLLTQPCTLKTEYDSKTSPCSSHYEQVKGACSSSIATTARENNGTLGRLGRKPRDDAPTSMGRG